jgi:hypothetical protein
LPPHPVAKGSAKIEHHESKEQFAISPAQVTWELVSRFGAKNEVYFEGRVNHPTLGPLAWRIWQYPREARDSTETNVGKHTLIDDFDLALEAEGGPTS